ncbi:hypothetical protein ACFVR1_00235 [Psychrobacillus sp. NPDC058041]|uniref:hypothetical protein n=1 Tax=Psychrobacillus sp. NPDC058041 TaxID=3346310 RepID=UPI0036D8C2AF
MELDIEKELKELIESLNQYISKIPQGCIKIAEYLRLNKRDEAYCSIGDFVEGMEWINDSINVLERNDYLILLNSQKMKELLKEINIVLEQQDENLLADLFEYEAASFFEEAIQLGIVAFKTEK